VLWATTVLLFTLTQIYQPPRYFLVALPAVVWLVAVGLEDLRERLAARFEARRATLLVGGLIAAFALFHLARLGHSALLTVPRNDYHQRTAWLRQVLPSDAHVAAAPWNCPVRSTTSSASAGPTAVPDRSGRCARPPRNLA
jgi:hypothetical protein